MTRVLVIGAHPDDCEIKIGGTAALWVQAGVEVTFVSVTDGGAGHHEMASDALAARRKAEAEASGKVLGVRYEFLGYPDGALEPTIEARLAVVRLIRRCQPDLVLTHRPNDYHPDHRYTSQIVQDAAYSVTVPSIAADVPFLRSNPTFGYLCDHFTKPNSFTADVLVPIDSVFDTVVDAMDKHVSQFYEWLPFNMGILSAVPDDPAERKQLLAEWFRSQFALKAASFPDRKFPASTQFVEAIEISEYGAPLDDSKRAELFPFPTY